MIYTEDTKKALKICYEAHHGQLDKTGMPYVFHPFHLAEQMKDEDSVTVALLHDVIEDTCLTLDQLKSMGFNDKVIDALALLTHDPDTPYEDYIEAIKQNPIARAVKLADLRHNSDLSRFTPDAPDQNALARHKKYAKAIRVLRKLPKPRQTL